VGTDFGPVGDGEPAAKAKEPGRVPARGRLWGFAAGLVVGGALGLSAAWAWDRAGRADDRPATPVPQARSEPPPGPDPAEGLDGPALLARWQALQAAFVETAAPLNDVLDRAERLRADLPTRRARARDAEAAYLAARNERERAEADEAAYAAEDARGNGKEESARAQIAAAEKTVSLVQARLDDLKRSQKRMSDAWVAKGNTRAAADAAAALYFDKYIKTEESRVERAQLAVSTAKSGLERVDRFDRPKRLKELRAAVEAKLAEELTRQAAWEKAKTDVAEAEAPAQGPGLSGAERKLLDRLLAVISAGGARPPADADPTEFQTFCDHFEEAINEARAVSTNLREAATPARYNALVNRLLRARDKAGPE
jgi:hypothetical protein